MLKKSFEGASQTPLSLTFSIDYPCGQAHHIKSKTEGVYHGCPRGISIPQAPENKSSFILRAWIVDCGHKTYFWTLCRLNSIPYLKLQYIQQFECWSLGKYQDGKTLRKCSSIRSPFGYQGKEWGRKGVWGVHCWFRQPSMVGGAVLMETPRGGSVYPTGICFPQRATLSSKSSSGGKSDTRGFKVQ